MQTAPQPPVSKPSSAKPQCPNCDGQRYLRYDVDYGHPMFGKMLPCPECNKDAVALATGLNPIERKISFADIDTDGRPGASRMIKAAGEFIANGRTGFLTVHGGFGNAKSTLLKAIVNDCVSHGVQAQYITMTEVMIYAREAFESQMQGDSDFGRIRKLAGTQVLVIDELDKARVTEYAREVQTHLFDVRYRSAHALGTVVAWNGGFTAIDLPWVLSRLSQFTVVENNDADMRPLLGDK